MRLAKVFTLIWLVFIAVCVILLALHADSIITTSPWIILTPQWALSLLIFIAVLFLIVSIETECIFPQEIPQQQVSLATTLIRSLISAIAPGIGSSLNNKK